MRWYLFWVTVVYGAPIAAQEILSAPEGGTGPILFPADVVMLEAAEQREDLGCKVDPDKVFLGMDLKFHGGYEVTGARSRGNQVNDPVSRDSQGP